MAKLRKCRDCGKMVSKRAAACPGCGRRGALQMRVDPILLLLIVVACWVPYCGGAIVAITGS